jgi:hypothetical protein
MRVSTRGKPLRRRISFEEWLFNAPTAYLICRDLGHKWPSGGWSGDSVDRSRDGSVMLHMSCERCGLPRARYVGPMGEINASFNRMDYAKVPGYLFSEDGFVLDKNRRMQLRRELRRRDDEGVQFDANAPLDAGTVRPVSFIAPRGA